MEGTKEPDIKEPGAEDQGQVSELDQVSDPGPDPELDQPVNTTYKTKPSNYTQTSKVAPPYTEKIVEINDELFKKVLFFTLFQEPVYSNFSDSTYNINNINFTLIRGIEFLYNNRQAYLSTTGFVETIIVFVHYLLSIDFVTHVFVKDFLQDGFIDFSQPPKKIDIFNFSSIWDNNFMFTKESTNREKSLASYDDTDENNSSVKKCNSNICYDIIKLNDDGYKPYITQQQIDTLSNYVALLEKLITGQIVIEIKDGELFANNIKIGYKKNIKNTVTKFCKKTFASSATIDMEDDDAKLYDIILSVYRHPVINARYKLKLYNSNLCGGRNNKTRKRHRNKTTYKKMRKSHNIRKRKSNGTKRK